MTDLAAFAEEGFDTKAWINASCAAKGQDEPLERFLAELEMRLQLGAEELEATLTECSSAALRRVPFAQQEVSRLKGDVKTLQGNNGQEVASLAALLLAVGRYNSLHCLPGQRRQLLLALITASFDKLNKLIKEKLAALHSTRLLAGLLSDVLVAVRRLRELCMVVTGGTELPQLLLTLDKHAAGYLQRVQAAVGIISGR
eukprot:gene3991-4243_t